MPFVCECGSDDFYTHNDEEVVVYVNGDGDIYESGDIINNSATFNYPYKCSECNKEYSQIPPKDHEGEWIESRKRDYLGGPTDRCPICNDTDISAGSMDVAGKTAYQSVNCGGCDSTWTEIFYLKSVEIENYAPDFIPSADNAAEEGEVPNPNDAFKDKGAPF